MRLSRFAMRAATALPKETITAALPPERINAASIINACEGKIRHEEAEEIKKRVTPLIEALLNSKDSRLSLVTVAFSPYDMFHTLAWYSAIHALERESSEGARAYNLKTATMASLLESPLPRTFDDVKAAVTLARARQQYIDYWPNLGQNSGQLLLS